MVAGPGLAGGAAGSQAIVTVTARDSNRRRVTEVGPCYDITMEQDMATLALRNVFI